MSVHAELRDEGRLLVLTIDSAPGNVLDRVMMSALSDQLTAHATRPELRAVILTGAGIDFCFGASIEEHVPSKAAAMLSDFHKLIRQVASYPVPLISAVRGKCLGGGFELVLATHVVLACETAHFACPEIKLGVFPPVLAAIGALRLGGARAERMLLTGETMRARAGKECGFITEGFSDGDDPVAQAEAWYRKRLAKSSAFSLRQATTAARAGSGMNTALSAGLDDAEALYLDKLLPSHDGNEGITAYMESRRPAWTDQ